MNKIVKKANELNKYGVSVPELEIGDVVELNEVWDGEGEAPTNQYSYFLTDEGEDGESNYNVDINYEFEIVEENEDPLKTVVKITNINLI